MEYAIARPTEEDVKIDLQEVNLEKTSIIELSNEDLGHVAGGDIIWG